MNSWNQFLRQYKGSGLNVKQISKRYQQRQMVGGANTEKIWQTALLRPEFTAKLIKDPSLLRVHLINTHGEIDMEAVKNMFLSSDPTSNKKYFQWIINGYIGDGIKLMEDVHSRVPDALSRFISLRDGKIFGPNVDTNIHSYCGLVGCKNSLGLSQLLDIYKDQHKTGTSTRKLIKEEADLVYEDELIRVVHPKTRAAAQLYGQSTQWCTAAKKNNMFDTYNKDGPLYIIIPKKPIRKDEKYQIHFQSLSLMDETDISISDDDLDIYKQSLVNFIRHINPFHDISELYYTGKENDKLIELIVLNTNLESVQKFIFQLLIEL